MSYNINNIPCSLEEYLTNFYLEELKDNGFIREIVYQPKSFILSKEVPMKFYKVKETKKDLVRKYSAKKNLINGHIYTTDFEIIWELYNSTIHKLVCVLFTPTSTTIELNQDIPFIGNFKKSEFISYLEVKGDYDRTGDKRLFTSRTQPWLYQMFNTYVQMITPMTLFKATFIPQKALEFMFYKVKTKNKNIGEKKYNFIYRNLNQWLNGTTE